MLHSPPSSTHGTVRIDLDGRDGLVQVGNTKNEASQKHRAERRDQPAVAVGEGEDVMLVVLQTGHATCSG